MRAPFLKAVRIPLCGAYQLVERGIFDDRPLSLDRLAHSGAGISIFKRSNLSVLEEPLGIGLRFARQADELRQPAPKRTKGRFFCATRWRPECKAASSV